jgi:hypothetical protein
MIICFEILFLINGRNPVFAVFFISSHLSFLYVVILLQKQLACGVVVQLKVLAKPFSNPRKVHNIAINTEVYGVVETEAINLKRTKCLP